MNGDISEVQGRAGSEMGQGGQRSRLEQGQGLKVKS